MAGREPLSLSSHHHGKAAALSLSLLAAASLRATSELAQERRRTLTEAEIRVACRAARKPGPCRLSVRLSSLQLAAGSECARGPSPRASRPQEQGREVLRDRARPQPRSASTGRCGVSPLEGGAEDGKPALAQGKAFPLDNFVSPEWTASCVLRTAQSTGRNDGLEIAPPLGG